MSKENRVSDERLAEMILAAKHDAENQLSDRYKAEAELRFDILTELQSLRSKPVTGVEANADMLALDLTKRIEREFYSDQPGGAVQTRAKVQLIIAEALSTLSYSEQEPVKPQPMASAPFDQAIIVWWPIVAIDDETGDLTDTEVDGRWLVTEWNGGCWLEPDVLNALNSNYFDDDCEYARDPKRWLPLPAALKEA